MSEFTSKGVVTSSLDEWYQKVINFATGVWGANFVTDPATKQGASLVQLAELLYNAEMNNVSAFAQLNINTATGICLDYLGQIKGITRNAGFPQQITAKVTSTITGYSITPDLTFQTTDGLYTYVVPSSVDIENLEQDVVFISTDPGNPEVAPGDTLRTISYFPQITNVEIKAGSIIAGKDTENDEEYRTRIQAVDINYTGTLELMTAELLAIEGMSKINCYYNDDKSPVDEKNIPIHATEFLVVPNDGVDDETFNRLVAQRYVEIKEPGAPTFGNTSVQVQDYYGQDKTINFTRPMKVEIQFKAKIGATTSGEFSIENLPFEKQQMMDYVNAMKIGTNVEWSRLLGFIASDPNFVVLDWAVRRKDGQWGQVAVPIDFREYAWIQSLDDIVIGVDDI